MEREGNQYRMTLLLCVGGRGGGELQSRRWKIGAIVYLVQWSTLFPCAAESRGWCDKHVLCGSSCAGLLGGDSLRDTSQTDIRWYTHAHVQCLHPTCTRVCMLAHDCTAYGMSYQNCIKVCVYVCFSHAPSCLFPWHCRGSLLWY